MSRAPFTRHSFVAERLANNEQPGDVADALLDLCLKKRSRDNMTAVIRVLMAFLLFLRIL